MNIGFTGTRKGMNRKQKEQFYNELDERYSPTTPNIFHHGDCIGADEEAHVIAWDMCYDMIIHPPIDDKYRAFCTLAIEVLEPKPYIERNHAIVDTSEILIAAPEGPETLRSGTWATVRYAIKTGVPVIILDR